MSTNPPSTNVKSPLEAAQKIVAEVHGMTTEHQSLALKFAIETLGLQLQLPHALPLHVLPPVVQNPPTIPAAPNGEGQPTDIKAFTSLKAPKSDQQFTAVVAYFYQFKAPANQRRDSIDATLMKDAARLVVWGQSRDWNATLNNALRSGYLDRAERGAFKLSSVGENLVAITLPDNGIVSNSAKKSQKKKASKATKPASKRAEK